MEFDIIETAKNDLHSFLYCYYKKNQFTVKYDGEFFIASAHSVLINIDNPISLPDFISGCKIKQNRIIFTISDLWLRESIGSIDKSDYLQNDIEILSQIKRLEKQLEFKLTGNDNWNVEMSKLIKGILYFLHTKSHSICQNIVKRCAVRYNILQRKGKIPKALVYGYLNALCIISKRKWEL